MCAPDVVIGLRVSCAESFPPQDVVGRVDDPIVRVIARERHRLKPGERNLASIKRTPCAVINEERSTAIDGANPLPVGDVTKGTRDVAAGV
jgi:hypothetical protein